MIRLSPNDACLMTAPRMRPRVWYRDKKFHRVLLIGRKFSALDLVSLILWRIDCVIWLKNSFPNSQVDFRVVVFLNKSVWRFLFYSTEFYICCVLYSELNVVFSVFTNWYKFRYVFNLIPLNFKIHQCGQNMYSTFYYNQINHLIMYKNLTIVWEKPNPIIITTRI